MNNVNLIGRLTKDPETRKSGDLSICRFTLAVDDVMSKDDHTDFARVVVFGNQADVCQTYLKKGFMAGVSGRFHSDKYTDSSGVVKFSTEIKADRVQFLQWEDKKREAESAKQQ